ncbi:fimbrillin-A associated anchor protein Mfa1/Mfa2 [Dysgonomonas alginatilytica]|uniref:Fimbrillin-A associated anchor protein Mfa1/Mfa2 n=1 Tax=Dysgonomonas alginatilytica TaxID=1605892 RepID=A0A2V3PKJ5_9BACT|nr:FimB/Mfa2 family fimbrial subunit [Dysgonomonas alginatilytica]PXV59437.1 fimbrillin-A associated anchor protein Mfa1/Mfa2 [Dysgonomonas alginatilytica]
MIKYILNRKPLPTSPKGRRLASPDKQSSWLCSKSPLGGLRGLGGWVGLLLLLLFTSCDIDGDIEVCEYNTRIIYRYNRENTSTDNILPMYVQTLDEYIFDEQGVLVMINRLPGTSCFGEYVSETNLPEGKYSVITWGNKAEPSKVNKEQIGVTTKQEMMLYLDNAHTALKSAAAVQSNAERLYYGYRTFTIEKYGVSKINVDMTHAHCVLNITVKWKNAAEAPENTGDFHLMLRDIAPQEAFVPEYTFRGNTLMNYTPDVDTYQKSPATVRHNIPFVDAPCSYMLDHRTVATMSYEQVLNGEFITYRHRDLSQPLLSLYAGSNRLMKEIDLQRFFQDMGIQLDTNLRQEFAIEIVIDGDKVMVGLVNIDDWEEGGIL